MKTSRNSIGLVPLGPVTPPKTAQVIAAHIEAFFGLPADILPPVQCPSNTFNPARLQYNAAAIIAFLEKQAPVGCCKTIGLFSEDIFLPIFTHVFGEARQGGCCALVSTFRLHLSEKPAAPPVSLVLERAAKVALHELGHLFNLVHCEDRCCLMHFSGDLEDLDATPTLLCRYCRLFLSQALEKA